MLLRLSVFLLFTIAKCHDRSVDCDREQLAIGDDQTFDRFLDWDRSTDLARFFLATLFAFGDLNDGDRIFARRDQVVIGKNQIFGSVGLQFPSDFLIRAVGVDHRFVFDGFGTVDHAAMQHRFAWFEGRFYAVFQSERSSAFATCVNVKMFFIGTDK